VLLQAGLIGGIDVMPKCDMFPCKEENFDFPVCIESLNHLTTVLNVKYNSSGDSRPMPIAVRKRALRKESDIVILREANAHLHEIRKRKANWIGHILHRNCLLKQVIEGKIKGEMGVTRRHRKLLDNLKDRRGYSHLKEEALDRTVWRNRFGGGFEPVVRQNTE
jgi:hypothetical protein